MRDDLKTIRKNGWTWHICDPAVLDPWFADYQRCSKEGLVKENANRAVFRVDQDDAVLYVKHDRPKAARLKVKSLFRSKVKAEYLSYQLLRQQGIPVVDYLGWARHGSEGMLISRALPQSVNAKHFWFGECICKDDDINRQPFLAALTEFLQAFFATGLYHPDFHLGNLLYQPREHRLFLVDPYGVTQTGITKNKWFDMFRIIGAMRGELTDEDAIALIDQTGMTTVFTDPAELWNRILTAEAAEMIKLWPKRRAQILSGNSKYTKTIQHQGKPVVLRISQGGSPYVDEDRIDEALSSLPSDQCNHQQAQEKWLLSFKKDFHRIHHAMPVIWQAEEGQPDQLWLLEETDQNRLPAEQCQRRLQIAGIEE